jgi:hypothetical protein
MLASLKAYSRKRKTYDELSDIAELSVNDIFKINPTELSSTIFDRPNGVILSPKQKFALNVILEYKKEKSPISQEEYVEDAIKILKTRIVDKKASVRIASAVTKKVGGKSRRSSRRSSRKVKGSRKVKKSSKKFNKSMRKKK